MSKMLMNGYSPALETMEERIRKELKQDRKDTECEFSRMKMQVYNSKWLNSQQIYFISGSYLQIIIVGGMSITGFSLAGLPVHITPKLVTNLQVKQGLVNSLQLIGYMISFTWTVDYFRSGR
ncbi:hypothetical protein BDR06DRAFT_968188 [Suillus hirtellus]|nr:hypothetical protein BDR06DRAFT_968188 [Suillus hirtellus]